MKYEETEKIFNSLHEFLKQEIHSSAIKAGGYTALSKKLGKDLSYISIVIARGSVSNMRKVIKSIKKIEAKNE